MTRLASIALAALLLTSCRTTRHETGTVSPPPPGNSTAYSTRPDLRTDATDTSGTAVANPNPASGDPAESTRTNTESASGASGGDLNPHELTPPKPSDYRGFLGIGKSAKKYDRAMDGYAKGILAKQGKSPLPTKVKGDGILIAPEATTAVNAPATGKGATAVVAEDSANVQTAGYKPKAPVVQQRGNGNSAKVEETKQGFGAVLAEYALPIAGVAIGGMVLFFLLRRRDAA